MTFDIYSCKSGKVIQRSAIRPRDPFKGGFPNNRIRFPDKLSDEQPDLVDEHADAMVPLEETPMSSIPPPPKPNNPVRISTCS